MIQSCGMFTQNFNQTKTFIRQINSNISRTHPQIALNPLKTRFLSIKNLFHGTKRNISFKYLKSPTHERLRQIDNIPDKFELIYRSTISSYIQAAQIAATLGAAVVCTMAVVNYGRQKQFLINSDGVELQNMYNSKTQLLVFGAGYILMNIAVMLLISKFPVRIYFNIETRKYLGVMFGKLPKMKHCIEFNVGEVLHAPEKGFLPWSDFKYRLKNGRIIILLDQYFRKPDDMNIMLGYTKL